MTIEICNLRNEKPCNPWDVRVDRTSVLGNPFYIPGEAQRNQVCDEYQEWLSEVPNDCAQACELDRLLKLYHEHGKLRLFCWCAPKRCHAETIKE